MLQDEFPEEYKTILNNDGTVSKFNLIRLAHKLKIPVNPGITINELENTILTKLRNDKNGTANAYDPYKIIFFDRNNVKNEELFKVFEGIEQFEQKIVAKNSKLANNYLTNTLQNIVLGTTNATVPTIVDFNKLQEWQDNLDMGINGHVPADKWDKMEKDCQFILARLSHLL